jgi:hypothetical protein
MSLDEFRKKMWEYRQAADRDASALKESNLAWDWLRDLYRRFDSDERRLADQVLEEWVLSEDENLRYDALILIGDFPHQVSWRASWLATGSSLTAGAGWDAAGSRD